MQSIASLFIVKYCSCLAPCSILFSALIPSLDTHLSASSQLQQTAQRNCCQHIKFTFLHVFDLKLIFQTLNKRDCIFCVKKSTLKIFFQDFFFNFVNHRKGLQGESERESCSISQFTPQMTSIIKPPNGAQAKARSFIQVTHIGDDRDPNTGTIIHCFS